MITIPEKNLKNKSSIVIESKGVKFIVMPLEDFSSLKETGYLLESEANKKHLDEAIESLNSRKNVVSFELTELP